jgi:hypothetical protein
MPLFRTPEPSRNSRKLRRYIAPTRERMRKERMSVAQRFSMRVVRYGQEGVVEAREDEGESFQR